MFKFGDKIQVTALSKADFKNNMEEGLAPDHVTDELRLGDIGIFVKRDTYGDCFILLDPSCVEEEVENYDHERYGVDLGDVTTLVCCVAEKDIELHTEESELKVVQLMSDLAKDHKFPVTKEYSTLEESMEFKEDVVEVGCQTISKKDALQIAADIQAHFGK